MAAGVSVLNAEAAAAEASIEGRADRRDIPPGDADTPAYTLTGSVAAPETLNALTVNNQAVAASADGAFAFPVSLGEGANTFTLRASDELDRIATKVFTVTLTTPGGGDGPAPPPPVKTPPVAFETTGKPALKRRTVTTGVITTCPGLGPDCTVSARATAAGHATGRTLNVAANASVAVRVTITKAAARRLRRKRRLAVVLALTGAREDADGTTLTRTLTLRRHAH